MNKFINVYIKTKNEDKELDYSLPAIKIYEQSKEDKKLYTFNKDKCIYFCTYKTTYKDGQPSVIIVFTIDLPGNSKNSGATASMIMELVADVTKQLGPMEYSHYNTICTENNKNIGFLKFIKIISELDTI